MLGQLPGHVAVGELRRLWDRGVLENRRCGCEARFGACPFWSEVGVRAFGGWSNVDARQMAKAHRELDRRGAILGYAVSRTRTSVQVRPVAEILRPLLAAIREVSGRHTVVDSSKSPGFAAALRSLREEEMRVVHIVRDPRGVVFSEQRRAARRREHGETVSRALIERWSARWVAYNVLVPRLFPRNTRTTVVRYEDLATGPNATLQRMLADIGEPADVGTIAFVDDDAIQLETHHTVYGNPMRRTSGRVEIRLDEEWRTAMPETERRRVALLTKPLRGRYGYPGEVRRRRSTSA